MNTKQMLIFKHFVEYQNENMVAEKLNITQPTVTFHLKNLNQRYGTPLYHKRGSILNSLKLENYYFVTVINYCI